MDTKQLTTFVTLAEVNNYIKAADRLNYAPSTLAKHIHSLEQELEETARSLRKLETQIKEQNIHITDTYGPYLGKEFLEPDKISELSRLIQSGTASNITEAIEFYKNSRTEKTPAKAAQP